MPFEKGKSGNPSGRPPRKSEVKLGKRAERQVMKQLFERALKGDSKSAAILLARFAPVAPVEELSEPITLQYYISGMDLTKLTAAERKTLHDLIGKADPDCIDEEELEQRRQQFEAAERGERPAGSRQAGFYEERGQARESPAEDQPVVRVEVIGPKQLPAGPAPEPKAPRVVDVEENLDHLQSYEDLSPEQVERFTADGWKKCPDRLRPRFEGVPEDGGVNDGYGRERRRGLDRYDMSIDPNFGNSGRF